MCVFISYISVWRDIQCNQPNEKYFFLLFLHYTRYLAQSSVIAFGQNNDTWCFLTTISQVRNLNSDTKKFVYKSYVNKRLADFCKRRGGRGSYITIRPVRRNLNSQLFSRIKNEVKILEDRRFRGLDGLNFDVIQLAKLLKGLIEKDVHVESMNFFLYFFVCCPLYVICFIHMIPLALFCFQSSF